MSSQTLARRLRLHTQHIEQSAGNKLLKMELLKMRAIAEAEAIARLRALCAELSVYKMHVWLRDTLNERLWQTSSTQGNTPSTLGVNSRTH
jgi:hypothetical protein